MTTDPTAATRNEMPSEAWLRRLLGSMSAFTLLMTVPPNVRHVSSFRRLQSEARSAGRGLWARPSSRGGTPRGGRARDSAA